MTEYLQDKHFQPSPHFVMDIGTINLKYDDPGIALDKIKLLVQSFKKSYSQSSLALTTLSPLLVRGTKSSVDHVRTDITEYNRLLTSIDGVDIIKVNYDDRSMVCEDGIHLSDSGTPDITIYGIEMIRTLYNKLINFRNYSKSSSAIIKIVPDMRLIVRK
ncbi:unnamed protein product [Didymodactylos carnosus]|uniref:SGNH hydrolase-type esterase domain-containing protein n=1 Tax=Didymodactylos carnosus TaxID=1234261 RepID=A0A815YI44_9BILA|nr:unnamed protein product [Didymodactylos carnosus]CAF1570365.1 unnamed protein product [Didymodactylos carnosus]CAF4263681.1 unnamed protein product [Didymodactylos carnosus]CAF4433562.1 unnamed protein product [Didymodactylos carnosus]